MRYRLSGYRYSITVDGKTLFDQKRKQNTYEMITTQSFDIEHLGRPYRVIISPTSLWKFGIHIYQNKNLVYRYKDRDFKKLPRLEAFCKKVDSQTISDDRPFWKVFVEAIIVGFVFGILWAKIQNYLEAENIIKVETVSTGWVILAAVLLITFWPSKLRFIR